MEENKVKLYKKWWFCVCIILIIIAVMFFIVSLNNKKVSTSTIYTNNNFFNNKPTKENIKIEKIAIPSKDTCVIKMQNNNNSKVVVDNISAILKDSNGNFVKKINSLDSNIPLNAGQNTISWIWDDDIDDDLNRYANFEFTFDINNTTSTYYINDNFEVIANNNGKQLAVTVKNNNNNNVLILFNVVYYLENQIVGFSGLNITDEINANSQGYININYPYDENGKAIKFDNYKIYLVKAKITN